MLIRPTHGLPRPRLSGPAPRRPPARPRRRAWRWAVILAVVAWGADPIPFPAAASPCYQHPVAAPVRRGFEAAPCRWCAGHRGLEYATGPGDPVAAAAGGTVAFAGLVAGARWVSVDHPDGLRTSYGPLGSVGVRRGQPVEAGARLGTTAGALHVGVRRGDTYLDPAGLFHRVVHLVPRLVPLTGPRPSRPGGPTAGCVR